MKLVDLFCGCGGFSLGAHKAGFKVAAAYDIDADLTHSFNRNFPTTKLFLTDLTQIEGTDLLASAGGEIDGIFGGPPCQGFSDIGRRAANDPRRQLLGHFFRLVSQIEPTFFIMENVRGLAYHDARHVLDQALNLVRTRYELLGPIILDASTFGAATRRNRLFVIGMHKDRSDALSADDFTARMTQPTNVRDAIVDLAGAVRVSDDDGYDVWKIKTDIALSPYAARMRTRERCITGHLRTAHGSTVVERFAALEPGKIDLIGRHHKLSWTGQCPNLRAGTGAERGSFQSVRPIHPEEPRVITVREAARLQGFSDEHRFHPTIWHSFRMIGNSVSPIIAREIFLVIAAKLGLAPELAVAAA